MLYVAIGLITLLGSFLIALVILIRELGQRAGIEESFNDFSADFAEAVVPADPNGADPSEMTEQASVNPSSQEPVSSSDLNEVVPFPWVMESTSQPQVNVEQSQETETDFQVESSLPTDSQAQLADAFTEPVRGQNRGKLDGEVSLSELAGKN